MISKLKKEKKRMGREECDVVGINNIFQAFGWEEERRAVIRISRFKEGSVRIGEVLIF